MTTTPRWHTRTVQPRTHAPRTHSGCCKARVEHGRCSECRQAAPWRQRLTADEAGRIVAREMLAALPKPELSEAARVQHLAAMFGEAYDD